MRNLTMVGLVVGGMMLAGCSHDADEPHKEPGSFLRPGGDVVIGGQSR